MWNSYRPGLVFLWILSIPVLIAPSSYVRHLSLVTDINHLTYFSSFKWLYVSSINSLAIYDHNLTLLQHISIHNTTEKNFDPCAINSCQCLHNTTESDNENAGSDRNRRSQSASSPSIDSNNHNLILYLEKENQIEKQPYLIDCWSLQTGSCIVRNALNLSDIHYQQQSDDSQYQAHKLLFNTDAMAPNHVVPFHLKLNKCNSTPTYLFLTSTLRKNLLNSNNREKLESRADRFDLQCLEQAQRRTIALRVLVDIDERRKSSTSSHQSSGATLTTPRNAAIQKDSWMPQQVVSSENTLNNTRPSSNNNKSNLLSSASLLQSSAMISMASDAPPLNSKDPINQTSSSASSSMTYTQEQGPFVNINDYCPEQLSVLRSIYTDFFERESAEKFRLFQDIVYDREDAAIYVFTNQQHQSKVIRLCEGQISFRHYVELPIHCGDEYTLIQKVKLLPGENGKEFLLVIASKPRTSHSLEPSVHSHSALCVYEFDQIRNAFVDSVLDLAKGNVSLGMAWLHGESVIPQYPTPYGNLARCSTMRDASYLMIYEGSSDIHSPALMTFPADQLTSLEATMMNRAMIAFVGTADGKIKKISVEPTEKKAVQFDELFVHYGESVLRDMTLDENGRFLYGATRTRLFQVDLHDCDRHKTCFSCLATQNPYCGWRTTLNRCAVRTNATKDARPFSWLHITDRCPNILEILPKTISKARSSKLYLKVDSVPDDSTSKYYCSFSFSSLLTETPDEDQERPLYVSNATKQANSIQCDSPSEKSLSIINHDFILLHLLYNDIILTEKNLTFYDCSSYLTCTSCLNNSFNCVWHLLTTQCIDQDLHSKMNSTSLFLNHADRQCPRFNTSVHDIFVADGEPFTLGGQEPVRLVTMGMKTSIQQHLRCALTRTNGSVITSAVTMKNDLLTCDAFQIFYDREIGQEQLTLDIQWTECVPECTYKKLEALSNFTVNIYKCKFLADSCGSCILLHDDYRCVWCETDKSCRHEVNASLCNANHIISPSMGICPDPRLRQIHPQAGPQFGQTPIYIDGSSLGKKPDDVSVVLIHANRTEYPCRIHLESYVTAQSFHCQPPPLPMGVYTLKVTVHSVVSKDRPVFRVVKPTISAVHPNWGPRSGGTLLSIRGAHLNIGSQIHVFVGNQECLLLKHEVPATSDSLTEDEVHLATVPSNTSFERQLASEEETIQCRTSKLATVAEHSEQATSRFVKRQALWIGSITISIDNFTETYSNMTYSYTEDPHVFDLSRYSGIQSGGLPFIVRGINFNSIQTPQFFLEYNETRLFIENCSVQSAETLICLGPSLRWFQNDTISKNLSSIASRTGGSSTLATLISSTTTHLMNSRTHLKHSCLQFKFGFYMDDVEHVRNTSTYHETFLLCPDPEIYPFDNDGKRIQYRYDYLTIEGSNLLDVATIEDYFITIGSYPCNITSISDKQIVCQPTNRTIEQLSRRKRFSLDLQMRDYDQAIVRVALGRRIYTLGTLTYTSNMEKRSLVLYYIIASVCGFLLTVFIIIVSVIFRRINTKRTRQLHRLQNQIDTLEMRVARECKEAFAELQTDIGEMTNDLSHSGVPYHDYRTFCMKVLFPNGTDEEKYMMLHNIEIPLEMNRRQNVQQGLQLLSKSLYNRHFLLLIIHTLEADKIQFRLQDRMQFASLISVLLQENIDYFTEILKLLLKELIDKSLQQDRNNSKILLRSNASVAEKMLSNWFAFLLFPYIKDRLGSPLYILFQSIKQQIQKGPIDAITHESRYSLSEDKLLRQHIDYSSMIVYVVQVEEEKTLLTSTPVPIKVLSCDSITQVKEKIVDHFYKNTPYSKRPAIDDFDLEWRIGSHMKLLRDEERIDASDANGFAPMQTLATYKVHDGARLFLSLKPGTNHTNTSSFSSLSSSQTISGIVSNNFSHCLPTNGSCCIKSTDTDQHWQALQSTENQVLLQSTMDLIHMKREHRINSTTPADPSLTHARVEQHTRFYHLVKATDREDDDRTLVTNNLVSEVYLTRLLATKGSLQQYIDNFFDNIFCLADMPSPIKYLFDFLDEQAEYHQISDTNILHTWKSNSLPLRFFVNVIKNPDFIFDVQKSNVIDASLSVIAQMFMDSCAAGTHQLTKDSPSSKLLFYRDVQKYKKLVEKYYDAISSLPAVPITDLDRSVILLSEQEEQDGTRRRPNEFNRTYALFKLYNEFLSRYKTSLRAAIASDPFGKQYRLAALFDQIVSLMESFELDV